VIWQNGPLATGWSACHSRIGRPREAKPDSGNPPVIAELQRETTGEIRFMAVKIKLTRLGKIRNPQYRIAVADARNRRDGRAIEVIGRYHPKEDPSLIEVDSDRAQYWLSVGAQPTEPVLKLLKITGDWQKFKGLPGTEGTLQVKAPKPSKLELFNAALAAGDGAPSGEATQLKKKKAPAKKAEAAADDAAVEAPAEVAVEAAPADAPAEAPAEAAPADAPVEEAPADAPAEAAVDAEAPAEADAAAESAEPAAE
jgi:small subunit ribosomal protein S16